MVAPKDTVFAFLSNIENLSKLSTKFVKKIILADGKYKAVTPIGDVFIRLNRNENAGLNQWIRRLKRR